MIGRGRDQIDIVFEERYHVLELVGIVGAIAVHGTDNVRSGGTNSGKYRSRHTQVSFMSNQRAVQPGSKQALQCPPGSVNTSIIDKNELQLVFVERRLNALERVGEVEQISLFIEAGNDYAHRNLDDRLGNIAGLKRFTQVCAVGLQRPGGYPGSLVLGCSLVDSP